MLKETLEQSNSPSSSPETKSREEQRWEYYRDNQERIESNNHLINDFNSNRYGVFSIFKSKLEEGDKEYYIHLFNSSDNRGQLSYSFGIDQIKKYDEGSAKDKEIPFLERINKGDKSAYLELNNRFSDEQFKLSNLKGRNFNFTEDDKKYGFIPSIKNIMLLRKSDSFMGMSNFTSIHRIYIFTLNNIQIPTKPEEKNTEKKKEQIPTKKEVNSKKPKDKTPAKVPAKITTIDPDKKQSIDTSHQNIKAHPELSYTYTHIHNNAQGVEQSRSEKYYIINNNGDMKEVNKDVYIDYKIAVLRWKEQDRDVSIFTFFMNLYPKHSGIFSK